MGRFCIPANRESPVLTFILSGAPFLSDFVKSDSFFTELTWHTVTSEAARRADLVPIKAERKLA
ncbi:MAG: hypothetical protein ACJ8EL_12995 [Rhizomicrobium sp.]